MYKLYNWLLLLGCSLIFSQTTLEFTEEEVKNLYNSIQKLEYADSTNQKIIENLNSQIYMYIRNDSLNINLIENYKKQLEFKEEIIKLVKPKWYDNKYLWFFGGMIITSGAVYLAGQID